MNDLQKKQAEYLSDLFTLCEGWLYDALLPGQVPVTGRFSARKKAIKQACKAVEQLPPQPLLLDQWLPNALQSGRVSGLYTPRAYLSTKWSKWGWQRKRLAAKGGERPALEWLAAALCDDGRLDQTECEEELAAWHWVVALCLAAQQQAAEASVEGIASKDAAAKETCGELVRVLADGTAVKESVLFKMRKHCADLQKHELARWGNGYTLRHLVYTAWHNRQLAVDEPDEFLLPASVLHVKSKSDVYKMALVWKVAAMQPGEWVHVSGDACKWLNETKLESILGEKKGMLSKYGDNLSGREEFLWPEEDVDFSEEDDFDEEDADLNTVPAESSEQDRIATGDDIKLLDYCLYPEEGGAAKIYMVRWKEEQQVEWPDGHSPEALSAEWFTFGGPYVSCLMEQYGTFSTQYGKKDRIGPFFYNEKALSVFSPLAAAEQDSTDRQRLQTLLDNAVKYEKVQNAPEVKRFNLVDLFGPKPRRTDQARFVKGVWRRWSASVPNWNAQPQEVAALHQWLEELMSPDADWADFAQNAFKDGMDQDAPQTFAQAVENWGCERYARSPEWAKAYLTLKGKPPVWRFIVK